jgi:tyrosyl-tRNA synthetase
MAMQWFARSIFKNKKMRSSEIEVLLINFNGVFDAQSSPLYDFLKSNTYILPGIKMELKQVLQDFSPEVIKETQRQLDILEFKTLEITPLEDFIKMLGGSIANKKPLRIKCGIDPTGSDIHLGHTIPYRKMRDFQDLGHIGVVVIGDYTAQIGDPSGKTESRPTLSQDQVDKNAQNYMDQVYSVLDPAKTEVRRQSEWFKDKNLLDVMSWAKETTVAKLLSHDTFRKRIDEGHSLALHELFYPVLQGMDSVSIKADVELGGSDQKFNVLMGRDYQKNAGLRPQVAMLLPIINGTCGTAKMSKSLDNYIGIFDAPFDKFGKVMSIPDSLMDDYAHFASSFSKDQYLEFKKGLDSGQTHPNEAKKQLASNIVALFHGADVGVEMKEQFERVFAKKKLPDEILDFEFEGGIKLINFLVEIKFCASNGEARRLIKQSAVSFVDGDKVTDQEFILTNECNEKILKVGKRKFAKLLVK